MALSVRQLVRRHGALPAAVTAVGVGGALVAGELLKALIGYVAALPHLGGIPYGWGLVPALLVAGPFAAGYFLSLWIIAPIAEELRVGHVITRAVLATGVGATLVFVVAAVLALVTVLLLPWFVGDPAFSPGRAADALGSALATALTALVSLLPLGVLGGVLLWLWRKDHPPKHPLSGLIDEV